MCILLEITNYWFIFFSKYRSIQIVYYCVSRGRYVFQGIGSFHLTYQMWGEGFEQSSLYTSIIPCWLMVLFSLTMSLLTFCLLNLFISDRGLILFPDIIVASSISPCSYICVCLIYFDTQLLRICILKIVILVWRIGSLLIMECISFSQIIFLALKSALSEITIAIPASFWLVVAWYTLVYLYLFALNLHVYI